MEIVRIEDKEYLLDTNAASPIVYRKIFGRDYFKDLISCAKLVNKFNEGGKTEASIEELEDFDMMYFYRLFYIFHKTAKKDILPFDEFFETVPSFPLDVIAKPILEMMMKSMSTKKKLMNQKMQAMLS